MPCQPCAALCANACSVCSVHVTNRETIEDVPIQERLLNSTWRTPSFVESVRRTIHVSSFVVTFVVSASVGQLGILPARSSRWQAEHSFRQNCNHLLISCVRKHAIAVQDHATSRPVRHASMWRTHTIAIFGLTITPFHQTRSPLLPSNQLPLKTTTLSSSRRTCHCIEALWSSSCTVTRCQTRYASLPSSRSKRRR